MTATDTSMNTTNGAAGANYLLGIYNLMQPANLAGRLKPGSKDRMAIYLKGRLSALSNKAWQSDLETALKDYQHPDKPNYIEVNAMVEALNRLIQYDPKLYDPIDTESFRGLDLETITLYNKLNAAMPQTPQSATTTNAKQKTTNATQTTPPSVNSSERQRLNRRLLKQAWPDVPGMIDDIPERLRFFDRQFLRAQDFSEEQDYYRERWRLHNRLLHMPGIAEGLGVTATKDTNAPTITIPAGVAIDSDGNQLTLPADITFPLTADGVKGLRRQGDTGRPVPDFNKEIAANVYLVTDVTAGRSSSMAGIVGETRWQESAYVYLEFTAPTVFAASNAPGDTPPANAPVETPPALGLRLATLSKKADGAVTVKPATTSVGISAASLTLNSLHFVQDTATPGTNAEQAKLIWGENRTINIDANLLSLTSTTNPNKGSLTITKGDLTLAGGNLAVTGGASVSGDLSVNGTVKLGPSNSPMVVRQWDVFGDKAKGKQGIGRWGMFQEPYTLFLGVAGSDYPNTSYLTLGGWKADGTREDWMTLVKGGNVGIGTSEPKAALQIAPASGMILGRDYYTGGYTSLRMMLNQEKGGNAQIQAVSKSGTAGGFGDLILNLEGGNVGIGTATPRATLDVSGTIGVTFDKVALDCNPSDHFDQNDANVKRNMAHYGLAWFRVNPAVGPQAWLSGYGGIRMFTGGALRFEIDNNGATSISGVLTPSAGSSNANGILFSPASSSQPPGDSAYLRYYVRPSQKGNPCTLELGITNDANDHIALMPSGNVGIDILEPKAKLHIGDENKKGSEGMLRFSSRSASNSAYRSWEIGVPKTPEDASGDGYSFVVRDVTAPNATRLMIRWDNGNVGIGTSAPRTLLDVNGTLTVSGSVGIGAPARSLPSYTGPVLDTGTSVLAGAANDYMKAQFTMSGGGMVTWSGAGGRLKWTARFIAIAMGGSTSFANGHINIAQPTADIPADYVHDGKARSATLEGVILQGWEALYAVHEIGKTENNVSYRIVVYNKPFEAPSNWILVAVVNNDQNTVKLGTGVVVTKGATVARNSCLPCGTILLWYGAFETIPEGWTLCNGQNGTPDLTKGLVMGAGNGRLPGYGGEYLDVRQGAITTNNNKVVLIYYIMKLFI